MILRIWQIFDLLGSFQTTKRCRLALYFYGKVEEQPTHLTSKCGRPAHIYREAAVHNFGVKCPRAEWRLTCALIQAGSVKKCPRPRNLSLLGNPGKKGLVYAKYLRDKWGSNLCSAIKGDYSWAESHQRHIPLKTKLKPLPGSSCSCTHLLRCFKFSKSVLNLGRAALSWFRENIFSGLKSPSSIKVSLPYKYNIFRPHCDHGEWWLSGFWY